VADAVLPRAGVDVCAVIERGHDACLRMCCLCSLMISFALLLNKRIERGTPHVPAPLDN
jgi:hypothetical protein